MKKCVKPELHRNLESEKEIEDWREGDAGSKGKETIFSSVWCIEMG